MENLTEFDLMERNVWAEEDVAGSESGGDGIGERVGRRESHGDEVDLTAHVVAAASMTSPESNHSHETSIEDSKTSPNVVNKMEYIPEIKEEPREEEKVETIVIRPLSELVPEEDRISMAALIFLTLHELSYRYCRYEYFGELEVKKSNNAEAFVDRFRRKSVEDQRLLSPTSDDEPEDTRPKKSRSAESIDYQRQDARVPLFIADFQRTLSADFPLNSSATEKMPPSPKGKRNDKAQIFSAPNLRIPFGEEMSNPESIQDAIFFNRALNGNVMLCFALKTFQDLSFSFMKLLYEQLHIEPEGLPNENTTTLIIERLFIERGIILGLSPVNLVKSITFLQKTFDISDSENEDSHRLRLILCNILLMILTVSNGKYGSIARVFMKRIVFYFNVDWIDVVEYIELPLLASIIDSATAETEQELNYMNKLALKERDLMLKSQTKKRKRKRVLYMTAAAVGGGALIGITTGLAAPLVGAGIGAALAAIKIAGATTFFGSVGGTALITSGGVLTGTSIAGIKMEKRTREVEYFKFVPLHTEGENIVICISGWLISQDGKGKDLPGRKRTSTSTGRISETSRSGESTPVTPDAKNLTDDSDNKSVDLPDEVLENGMQDLITPFMGISPINGQLHSLIFDPQILRTLGDALKIFASEVVSLSANVILAQTILSTLMAGLTWPMWLAKLGYLVDNPWSLGLDRAKKAGKLLADRIKNLGRSVSLVGFSLGARTIYYCLLELAKEGSFGLIEDVFLFGTPVLIPANVHALDPPTSVSVTEKFKEYVLDPQKEPEDSPNKNATLEEWRMILSIVGGRFVNAYSRSDWVLGFLFRASVAGMWDVAGMRPVLIDSSMDVRSVDDYQDGKYLPGLSVLKKAQMEAEKSEKSGKHAETKTFSIDRREEMDLKTRAPCTVLENIDITSKVDGHLQYRAAMPALLGQICGFSTWSDDLEVIEQMFGGDWVDSVDGWWTVEQKKRRKRGWSNFSAGSSASSLNNISETTGGSKNK